MGGRGVGCGKGGRWEGVGGVLWSGCGKLICDVAEQRNVNLSSEFRDIHLIAIFLSINGISFPVGSIL